LVGQSQYGYSHLYWPRLCFYFDLTLLILIKSIITVIFIIMTCFIQYNTQLTTYARFSPHGVLNLCWFLGKVLSFFIVINIVSDKEKRCYEPTRRSPRSAFFLFSFLMHLDSNFRFLFSLFCLFKGTFRCAKAELLDDRDED
jgi:hypothetical protein